MTTSPRALLDARLRTLTSECEASCALVVDTSGQDYGASDLPPDWQRLVRDVEPLVAAATREHPLRSGGHLHLVRSVEPPFVAAESFAGVYMLLVLFDGAFAASAVTALVRRALPEIEALTVTQPPPDPSEEAGAARMRRA
jgi:hypothetical protein